MEKKRKESNNIICNPVGVRSNALVYGFGRKLANGFDARCTTQFINSASTETQHPPELYTLLCLVH